MKTCTRCFKSATESPFYVTHNQARQSSWCAACHREKATERNHRLKDKLKVQEAARRDRIRAAGKCYRHPTIDAVTLGYCTECRAAARAKRIKTDFGLSVADYDDLKRSGMCDVCERTDRQMHLDHDHDTNTIRGLLCGPCNMAIGLVKESPYVLRQLAVYLEYHRTNPGKAMCW